MQGSKIRLSVAEMELFTNAGVILTKNSILQKTFLLLADVQERLLKEHSTNTDTQLSSPKISKGENYLGLPYVVLDYPRVSNNEGIFFIRSFFWWGNFFSSTLQLSEKYKTKYSNQLLAGFEKLANENYFIGIHQDPWVHHFREDNYVSINSTGRETFSRLLQEQSHIKIAARWPLSEWDMAANKLVESWKGLMQLIS